MIDNAFKDEVKKMPSSDIQLILSDQQDLYNEDEISILQSELQNRPKEQTSCDTVCHNEFEDDYDDYNETEHHYNSEERKKKLVMLESSGANGYYEYKVVKLFDNESGTVDIEELTDILNSMGVDGWRLITAYSNEIGKTSNSISILGITNGTNATVDEHVLLFERYVKFTK